MRIGSPYGLALTTKPTKHLLTNIVSIQDTWVARKIVSHIFTAAIKEDIVDTNPCSQVRRLKVIHTRDITKAVGKKYSEHFSHCTVTGVRQEYDIRKIGVVHLVIY